MKKILTARQVLALYNANSKLTGGFGQLFGRKCVALDRYQNQPKLCIFHYTFNQNQRNIQDTVHGGALSTAIDVLTTVGILRMTAHRTISVSLNTQFLNVIKPDEQVQIQTQVSKIGKQMVFTDCRIYTQHHNKRKLACKGQHIKYIMHQIWDFMPKDHHL